MIKFKNKDGKLVGILKDSSSEPEGEAFKIKEALLKEEEELHKNSKAAEEDEEEDKDEAI